MSIDRDDTDEGIRVGAGQLLARAAGAEARAEARLRAAVVQLSQPDQWRIDDRTRAQVSTTLSGMIAAIEGELRGHAARSLSLHDHPALGEAIGASREGVEAALTSAGLLEAPDLVAELLARVAQDMIGEALPAQAPNDGESDSLIVRLATGADSIVAAMATVYSGAEGRRRAPSEGNAALRTDLPAELHHRLVWWVAAGIAAALPPITGAERAAVDRALTDAALRSLAAHDESDRVEAAAMQLAVAIEATPAELPELAAEALRDRRLPLFVALLAQAMGVEYEMMRDIVLDPAGERLWIVARALDFPRPVLAQIGFALCEADPRRDLDGFADQLDMLLQIDPDEARLALAPLTRHPDFRAASRALAQGAWS